MLDLLATALAFVLVWNFFYGWLERWINTGGPYALDVRRKSTNKIWMGIGLPYHVPIMLVLSLCVVVAPLTPEIFFNPLLLLIAAANCLIGFLTEDWWVQFREWKDGEGWITKDDWSSKWGYIPVTGEHCVVPLWYLIYLGLAILLYFLFFLLGTVTPK